MKKCIAILLFVLALASCTKNTDAIVVYDAAVQISIPAEEVPYMDGILSDGFTVSGGKYYFPVSRRITRPNGSGTVTETNTMLAYVIPASGNAAYVCSDPLCSHITAEECRFVNLREYCFTDIPGVFYAYRDSDNFGYRSIWLADLNEGTSRLVHEAGWRSAAVGFEDGKLYFYDIEEITQGRQTVTIYTYYALDHETGEVSATGRIPDDWPYLRKHAAFLFGGRFCFLTDNMLIQTDTAFESIVEIAELPEPVVQWYLDRNTEEIFLLCGNRKTFTGSLYVVRDGKLTEVNLPHEEICSFSITEDRIYYTVYDPVYYGTSNLDQYTDKAEGSHKTYDYTGGKVYAVSRDNPAGDAETVYTSDGLDGNHMAYLNEFAVADGYLYFKEVELVREVINGVESVTISHPGAAAIRVNLADGTFMRIEFE